MFLKNFLAGFISLFFISSGVFSADLSNYTNANMDWKQFEGESVTVLLSKHPWQEQIEPLIPEFEELTGIDVKLKLLPENQYLTKVPADMEAGTFKFDVFMTQLYEAPKFCGEKWLADLEPLINDPSITDPNWYNYNDFFAGARDVAVIGNTYLSHIAITAESQVLVYRKDILDELGISVPGTMDELLAAATKITESGKAYGITTRGGPAIWWPGLGYLASYGGEYLDSNLDIAINSPESIAGADFYVKLAQQAPPGVTNFDWDEINTAMLSGQAAMFLDSSVIYPRLQDASISEVVGKVGVAPFPTGPKGAKPNSHYWTVSMNEATENKKAAWLFLQWATSPDMQSRLALAGILGPRTSSWEVDGLSEQLGDEFLDAAKKSLGGAVIPRVTPGFFERVDIFRAEMQEAILGNKDAESAMNATADAWSKL
tara:strand:- start:2284 stop:3573 length:1290 start_codon:yes stop_codon:yes gene_type:complete